METNSCHLLEMIKNDLNRMVSPCSNGKYNGHQVTVDCWPRAEETCAKMKIEGEDMFKEL